MDELSPYYLNKRTEERTPRPLFWRVVDEVKDFFSDWIPILFWATLCVVLVWAILMMLKHCDDERKSFMTDCLKDRKQYECTAMWRAGESHTVPVFIPISTGR